MQLLAEAGTRTARARMKGLEDRNNDHCAEELCLGLSGGYRESKKMMNVVGYCNIEDIEM